MPEFDQWWNDTKKHCKRVDHWLPHWRVLSKKVQTSRSLRYFTLCARSMIDIFMLVKEGIIPFDERHGIIDSVRFCECEPEQFAEIKEMIGREDAGFFGRLEKILLFEDDDFTGQFPTIDDISLQLEKQESLEDSQVEKLQLKRTHMDVKASFPYDYINLDYCEYYYAQPPGMLQINDSVKRILDWQLLPSPDGSGIQLDEFILAVTCRHDQKFPQEARKRLEAILKNNCKNDLNYKNKLIEAAGHDNLERWSLEKSEDFFFAGWPKDIAGLAKERGWKTDILEYVFYRRVNDKNEPYIIVCLVMGFQRSAEVPSYIPVALRALQESGRKLIDEIDRNSDQGRKLISSLSEIVAVRNSQAKLKERPELPEP